jgi:hypothetical protein
LHGGNEPLVRIDVGDGRDADARRLVEMSTAWMRMPGRTWPGAAASFLGIWVVMMVAMMLPSLLPMPWRDRQAVGRTGDARLDGLATLVGAGYFFVWTVSGMPVFPLGIALGAAEVQQPALARSRFTAWKARHLACCREAPGRGRPLPGDADTAWRHGLRLGRAREKAFAAQALAVDVTA